MGNMIIALGNTGNQIIKLAAERSTLEDVNMYAIDSVTSSITLDNIVRIKSIPIISDDKCGSGRDRSRGAAMYQFHEEQGAFEEMYKDAENAKTPVIVITSSAGGTGSGSVIPLCKALIEREIHVIPIIVCPAMEDPDAYQLNTNDLFIELDEIGVETYNVFRNRAGSSNYTPINNEIVDLIEIIFGKRYHDTTLDSIDDQDLDMILNMQGRFVAISAKAPDIPQLTREITSKMFTGYQPSWTEEDAKRLTFMSAFSLRSIFASEDFERVFAEVRSRIHKVFDEYRQIEQVDNNGVCEATIIVAGLPRPEIRIVDEDYEDAGTISNGMNRSKRPKFMKKRTASVIEVKGKDGESSIKKFNWH